MRHRISPSFRHALVLCAAAAVWLALAATAGAQLRVVTYNTYKNPDASYQFDEWTTILTAMGSTQADGVATPVDILALQEVPYATDTAQNIANLLNTAYGVSSYAATTSSGGDGYNHQAYVYNTATVTLQTITNVTIGTRPGYRARFQPVGYSSADAAFYMYNVHFKAYSDSSAQARRATEATNLRNNAASLGADANFIYAGDFNLTERDNEAAWDIITDPGTGQGIDPLDGAFGSALVNTYSSWSPWSRIDFQFISNNMNDGEGVALIDESYHTFGIVPTGGSGYYISPGELSQSSTASDHLPVMADYQLPAVMAVSVGSTPSRVIVGAQVELDVDVSNAANVVAAVGADELDYYVVGTGCASGGGSGSEVALGGADQHTLDIDTTTAGAGSGSVIAISTSEAVDNGSFTQAINIDVLDHANASFAAGADTDALTLDLGDFTAGGGTVDITLTDLIHNLGGTAGYTAALDLDTITAASGDTDAIGLVGLFTGLAAGSGADLLASLDTDAAGSFTAVYQLAFSDEDLPGATSPATELLSLTLTATVAPQLVGDVNSDGAVNDSDFAILAANFGLTGTATLAQGDITGDGAVNDSDFALLAASFGTTAPASAETDAIPEPGTIALSVLGLACAIRRGHMLRDK